MKSMTLRQSSVETGTFGLDGELFNVPVVYADELKESSVYDLAYSSVNGGYLPYLFVGYFSNLLSGKWYIPNARRHEDMYEAITRDNGKSRSYSYGQIWFSSKELADGELLFARLEMRTSLSNEEKTVKGLVNIIDESHLHEPFNVNCGRTRYSFRKSTGSFQKV